MVYRPVNLLWCLTLLPVVTGYAHYRMNIPNGEKVPSPCNPNYVWQGVGHQAKGGGGPRNPFGLNFHEQGYTWTKQLCLNDSDQDGKTNGEELGDPNCIWVKGSTPEKTTGLSHPGICEPYDSAQCKEINKFLDCTDTEFNCDAVNNDQDIQHFDLRLNETAVPSEVTTYMCQALDLPIDKDYHLVATKPYIVNVNVMHHITVYGCRDDANIQPMFREPYKCFMNRIPGCEDLIALWTVGNPGICYHENAGFRIGKTGYKKVMMELHWNNPMRDSTYTDSSGITLYLTPSLRAYDAGMIAVGTTLLQIPPGRERYTASSTCSSECTSQFQQGNINIIGAMNHMHYLGSGAELSMVSEDDIEHPLSHEESYSYDSPKFVIFDKAIVMEPGYELQLTCHYRSTSRTEVTSYGEGTEDEMCYAFIMYYPKTNWTGGDCITPYTSCGDDYCDFDALGDYSNPVTVERHTRLYSNCEPGHCKEGCLDVVRDIFQEPCFKGDALKSIKQSLLADNTPEMKLGIFDYFYRLDSCNAELAKEQCEKKDWSDGKGEFTSSSQKTNRAMFAPFIAVIISIFNL